MIRPLDVTDVDSFIQIRSDSLRLDPKSFGASPTVQIDRNKTIQDFKAKNDENFILGYFEDDNLVGTLGFIRNQNEKTRHKGFIWGVYVYKEYRGKGIGGDLMRECIERVKLLPNFQKLILGVSHISDSALALYYKQGFEEYGREKNAMIWDGKFIDEILMEKVLNP